MVSGLVRSVRLRVLLQPNGWRSVHRRNEQGLVSLSKKLNG